MSSLPRVSDILRVPRLPGVPDVFRRVRIPSDLDSVTSAGPEADPAEVGLKREQIERIWESAVSLYRTGVHPALQLCLRRNGRVVLDRAIGHARGNGPRDPEEAEKLLCDTETPFIIYSASKGVTAMLVHKLDEKGLLRIDDRVADYIPEYAAEGKEATTIGHVLAHRAGIAALPRAALDLDALEDQEQLLSLISESKPSLRPGRVLAYHAVSGGFILGEIVRRVSGKDIRQVLGEELLEPLGFRWMNYGVAREDLDRVGLDYVTGPPVVPPLSQLVNRVLGMSVAEVIELAHDPRFLRAIVPAANTVTTANELCRFWEIFRAGGELDGVRVMEPRTIRRALTEQSHLEVDLSLVFPTRFGYGLMLGADLVSLYGRDTDRAFGHLGLINIMGWGDPERGLSGGLITSGKAILYPELPRFYGLMQRIASEVPKVPDSELKV
jgi:CubicO group peptidase (beta-lactamase class C family)